MDLHDLPGIGPAVLEPPVHSDHRPLDDVRRRSLHGRVDGAALGVLPTLEISGIDLRQVQAAAENRGHEALVPGALPRIVHVALDARVPGEIEIHVLLSFRSTLFHAELSCQPEGGHAVDEAEIDRLCAAPLLRRDLIPGHLEDLGRRGPVDILAARKRLQQPLVPGEVRHDTQLDLGVIRRQQAIPVRGDEGLANPPAFRGAHGDVLQVGVRGG